MGMVFTGRKSSPAASPSLYLRQKPFFPAFFAL